MKKTHNKEVKAKEVKAKKENRLDEKEYAFLKELNNAFTELSSQIGISEIKKHRLLEQSRVISDNVDKFLEQLQFKYGEIEINIDTGAFIEKVSEK